MKRLLIFCVFFLLAAVLFTQEVSNENPTDEDADEASKRIKFSMENIFVGLGPEVNIYTRDGFSLGGTLLFGVDFNSMMSAGLRPSFFNDLNTVSVLETQAFFRFYLPWVKNLFLQIDAGAMFAFENDKTFFAMAAGGHAGYRLIFSDRYFIDFGARFGYPYMPGVNIIAGMKFPMSGKPKGDNDE